KYKRKRRWLEALTAEPRDPEIVRAKALECSPSWTSCGDSGPMHAATLVLLTALWLPLVRGPARPCCGVACRPPEGGRVHRRWSLNGVWDSRFSLAGRPVDPLRPAPARLPPLPDRPRHPPP